MILFQLVVYLALTTTVFATNVLVLGDSQSVGPFGERLFHQLSSNEYNTLSVASSGSTPDDWFTGAKSYGVQTRRTGKLGSYAPTGNTPLLSELIQDHRPDVVIMQFGGNYTNNKDDAFIIRTVKRMVKSVKDSGAQCFWVNNPDKRELREGLQRVWDLMEKAVGSDCPVFKSQEVTHYPDVDENGDGKLDGDGRHYDFPAGRPIATSWANSAFMAFTKYYPSEVKKKSAKTDEEIKCGRDLLMADAQRAIESMSAEEIKAALERLNDMEEAKERSAKDEERAEKLAKILVLIEKKGKVKIEDCTQLSLKGNAAQTLLLEIRENCKHSPQNVWAEITNAGQLKFTFATGATNGTKTVIIGGGGNLILGYRGQELKLGGNISASSISVGSTTSTNKYDHLLDYSIDLGIANLETFLKWQGSLEATHTPNGALVNKGSIRRNVVDTGLRYNFIDSETLKLKVGAGTGVGHLEQNGNLVVPLQRFAPSVSGSVDMAYKPLKNAELFISSRIQRDVFVDAPRVVAGVKAGGKLMTGPVGLSLDYGADYDGARIGAKVNHQVTANVIASIDPTDWQSESKRNEIKAARERERILWENALGKVRELRAQEEQKKKSRP